MTVTDLDLFPNGGWDVHHHIFDPSKFAYAPDRHLTPPPATIAQFLEFKKRVGITNSVLTHGLSYGADCTSLKSFVAELSNKKESSTKAIGVIDPATVTGDELREMHDAGIRGIRVNLYKYKAFHDVELQKTALREHAAVLNRYCPGWSMAFTHPHCEFWAELKPFLEEVLVSGGVKLVTDHFALLKGASMLPPECEGDVSRQTGFREIIELVKAGRLYVKVSAPYRVSTLAGGYEDLKLLVRAFFNANPRQVLWGSDWPHTPHMKVRTHEEAIRETPYLKVDDLAWLRSLRSWLSDEEWNLLMVENPRDLYDW
ncbi:hypothetical protein ASPWEDRAFT_187669 [Aspergillus wentii DTO 134E9]|uniref:Amidohydrolase-related domain-containing protein n=1 Tax=Aspergillus wentii DTO 134E9 TaxID=1073089 RepID=A0A1L9R5Q1_ASPWE|nr:uncharacterized protein ASPWEDRAFT_187669 [Aspergillus wentii DTO 134E9]KAI9925265.1 hypothetical protein MW887_006188 [Aspergillus wentii]OJJ30240.1 hypothetical protein ASPWEDRAFT_187669 [Aspergillus wentii DTO 134E9]